MGGAGSNDFGVMHAQEIITRYSAEPAVFEHRALLISVNRSATESNLYEATRYAWKLSKKKAEKAEVVLSIRQGLIVGAFVADRWSDATPLNFPGREAVPGRLGSGGEGARVAPTAAPAVHRLHQRAALWRSCRRSPSASPLRERLEALHQDTMTGDLQPYDVATARAAEARQPCQHVAGPEQITTTPRGRFTFSFCTKCRAPFGFQETL